MIRYLLAIPILLIGLFGLNGGKANETQPQVAVDNTWTLLLGGDVMLGRSVTVHSLDEKNDNAYPFLKIATILKNADISFINLENPIVEKCPRRRDGMVFCAPPSMLDGLILSGVDVVNLSNNHTFNYGKDGYTETKKYLTDRRISFVDSTTEHIINVKGTSVGFIGFDKDQQGNPTLTSSEWERVKNLRTKVDVLVVALHWGIEYKNHPTEGQRLLAKELSDLGVDIIAGHHPHWRQDIEKIGNTHVYYSMGNLIFDQMWSEETKKGLLIKLTFNGKTIITEEQIPTYIADTGQPIIMPSPKE